MRRLTLHLLFVSLILGFVSLLPASAQQPSASPLSIAPGTAAVMALIRPVWAQTAKAGDTLYAQTVFPVSVNGVMEVPAGSFVLAKILTVTRPTRKVQQAVVTIQFNKLVFADGYTLVLNKPGPAPVSAVTVNVSTANDLLLDNGSQVGMTFPARVALDATSVAQAIPLSHAPAPGSFKGATRCVPTAGSPGTPDTLVGGSPGTPPTVIPGGPGMPDTVIPGIAPTPPTDFPGTPSTPATYCPAPPLVVSSVAH
jgi:hypothetical protein